MTHFLHKRYQTTRLLDHNIPHMLSLFFKGTAQHMDKIIFYLKEDDPYHRHVHSEKIIGAVTQLQMMLTAPDSDVQAQYLHQTLREFCTYTLFQMNRLTRDKDVKLCYDLRKYLQQMSAFFEQFSAPSNPGTPSVP